MALVGDAGHFGGGSFQPCQLEEIGAEEMSQLLALPAPITVEGAKLFNPIESPLNDKSAVAFRVDPLLMVCIEYERKIRAIQMALNSSQTVTDETVLQPVPLPACELARLSGRGLALFSHRSNDNNNSYPPDGVPSAGCCSWPQVAAPLALDEQLCRSLVLRAVTALVCFTGFQTATDAVLELLTDAVVRHTRQLCAHLRRARDWELTNSSHGFADCVDRTLTDCTGAGVRDTLAHYRCCVVARCSALVEQHHSVCAVYCDQTASAAAAAAAASHTDSHVEESLLKDILSETCSATIGLQSLAASGGIDSAHFPNLSFECAEDIAAPLGTPMSSNIFSDVVIKQECSGSDN